MDEPSDSASCVFTLLSNSRRRALLVLLDSSKQAPAVADIARDIAEYEYGEPVDDLSEEAVQRVHTSLYHCHIPKLEDAEIIRYNQDQNTIAFTQAGERLAVQAQRLIEQATHLQPEEDS